MRACHATGQVSIPGQDKFTGLGFFVYRHVRVVSEVAPALS